MRLIFIDNNVGLIWEDTAYLKTWRAADYPSPDDLPRAALDVVRCHAAENHPGEVRTMAFEKDVPEPGSIDGYRVFRTAPEWDLTRYDHGPGMDWHFALGVERECELVGFLRLLKYRGLYLTFDTGKGWQPTEEGHAYVAKTAVLLKGLQ